MCCTGPGTRWIRQPARSAELMQGQLERFESLLTDLLEISRYDANAATLDAEPVDVCTIVLQSADVAQQLAERRGTKIEFRLPGRAVHRRGGPAPGRADTAQPAAERGRARRGQGHRGHRRRRTRRPLRYPSATSALGLRPGEEQLVFDRFWRADPARARTSGGTGLGLAIALEDARLHGGWLEAWGEPGQGSVFRLTLPRTVGGRAARVAAAAEPDAAERSRGRNRCCRAATGPAGPRLAGRWPAGSGAADRIRCRGPSRESGRQQHRPPPARSPPMA